MACKSPRTCFLLTTCCGLLYFPELAPLHNKCLCNMCALQKCRASKDTRWSDLSQPLSKLWKLRDMIRFSYVGGVRETHKVRWSAAVPSRRVLGVTFSPRVQFPVQTHTLTRLQRKRTALLLDSPLCFLIFRWHNLKNPGVYLHSFNIPNKPYFFQTWFSWEYTVLTKTYLMCHYCTHLPFDIMILIPSPLIYVWHLYKSFHRPAPFHQKVHSCT